MPEILDNHFVAAESKNHGPSVLRYRYSYGSLAGFAFREGSNGVTPGISKEYCTFSALEKGLVALIDRLSNRETPEGLKNHALTIFTSEPKVQADIESALESPETSILGEPLTAMLQGFGRINCRAVGSTELVGLLTV